MPACGKVVQLLVMTQAVQLRSTDRFGMFRGLHVIGSQRVAIYNVTVNNDFEIPNDDGMDIDSSKDVWVSSCNVTAWDDGICIKTTMRKSAADKSTLVCLLRGFEELIFPAWTCREGCLILVRAVWSHHPTSVCKYTACNGRTVMLMDCLL